VPADGLAAASFVAIPGGSAESAVVVPQSLPHGGLTSMQAVELKYQEKKKKRCLILCSIARSRAPSSA